IIVGEVLAVGLAVILVNAVTARPLHRVPVPLRVLRAGNRPCWNGVDAPIYENAELGIIEPVRRLVPAEGGVRGPVDGNPGGPRELLPGRQFVPADGNHLT